MQRRGFFGRYSGLMLLSAAGVAPCAGALILVLLALALDVPWAGILGVLAIAVGMTVALAALGFASMLAHRLILSDGHAKELGRFVSVAASVVVIATGAILLLGAAARQMGWA
jgi:ABC-type nickel/cobalt efflux system permease component RcnA